jgi:hypothetical protein
VISNSLDKLNKIGFHYNDDSILWVFFYFLQFCEKMNRMRKSCLRKVLINWLWDVFWGPSINCVLKENLDFPLEFSRPNLTNFNHQFLESPKLLLFIISWLFFCSDPLMGSQNIVLGLLIIFE